jgi:hypothetical protein
VKDVPCTEGAVSSDLVVSWVMLSAWMTGRG